MANITPGPWQRNVKPASHYVTVFSGRNTHVCCIRPEGKTEEECEANINLIAAAPDLLDILTRIYNAHRTGNNGAYMGEATLCPMFADMARDIIAKAEAP